MKSSKKKKAARDLRVRLLLFCCIYLGRRLLRSRGISSREACKSETSLGDTSSTRETSVYTHISLLPQQQQHVHENTVTGSFHRRFVTAVGSKRHVTHTNMHVFLVETLFSAADHPPFGLSRKQRRKAAYVRRSAPGIVARSQRVGGSPAHKG